MITQLNSTGDSSDVPEGVQILLAVWALRHKCGITNQEWKARLDISGHMQQYGVYYRETYSPMV
jgi:hypothetical protein